VVQVSASYFQLKQLKLAFLSGTSLNLLCETRGEMIYILCLSTVINSEQFHDCDK